MGESTPAESRPSTRPGIRFAATSASISLEGRGKAPASPEVTDFAVLVPRPHEIVRSMICRSTALSWDGFDRHSTAGLSNMLQVGRPPYPEVGF